MRAFWQAFADATGTGADYVAWGFGSDNTPELATELGLLVRDGPKRATTTKFASFEEDGEPLPEVGGYSVVLDSEGEPICIIRTTRVDVVPFGEVDGEFAWVEGEGDRSLKYWREAHHLVLRNRRHSHHRRRTGGARTLRQGVATLTY